jgi:hypothetical protein
MRHHATVDGPVPFTAEEEAEADAREAAWQAGEGKRLALAQIAKLEASITERRRREAILGIDGGWLANIDAQIATLRAQL